MADLSITFDTDSGPAYLAGMDLGALEGEQAIVQGFRGGGLVQPVVLNPCPDAAFEVTAEGAEGTELHIWTYPGPEEMAPDLMAILGGHAPAGAGTVRKLAMALSEEHAVMVVDPGRSEPLVLLWSDSDVTGGVRSLGVLRRGPSTLEADWYDVFVPGPPELP